MPRSVEMKWRKCVHEGSETEWHVKNCCATSCRLEFESHGKEMKAKKFFQFSSRNRIKLYLKFNKMFGQSECTKRMRGKEKISWRRRRHACSATKQKEEKLSKSNMRFVQSLLNNSFLKSWKMAIFSRGRLHMNRTSDAERERGTDRERGRERRREGEIDEVGQVRAQIWHTIKNATTVESWVKLL